MLQACSLRSSARRCGDATLACRQLCLDPTSTTSGWADGWAQSLNSSLLICSTAVVSDPTLSGGACVALLVVALPNWLG